MGMPAAKQGDKVTATDMHMIQPPGTSPPVLLPHPFAGTIDGGLSPDVKIMGMPAATVNSTASNTPPHVPSGGTFVKPPANRATIIVGSPTVFINGNPAARSGDTALTCNDPTDLPMGTVTASGTVLIG
ncbi:PAAR domain-containing protein [Geobacter sp.]|uniref:PAAR domain-containing protein n=1 Tax=Geobacter sp. TaxID=46610 RepID=UPI00345A14F3